MGLKEQGGADADEDKGDGAATLASAGGAAYDDNDPLPPLFLGQLFCRY